MPAKPCAHRSASHAHAHGFRWRTLLVGLMHGMAGSAALLVLAVSQASSPVAGLGYVALFGIGSMVGMGALSAVIAVPLAVSARWLTWANQRPAGRCRRHHHRDRRHDDLQHRNCLSPIRPVGLSRPRKAALTFPIGYFPGLKRGRMLTR